MNAKIGNYAKYCRLIDTTYYDCGENTRAVISELKTLALIFSKSLENN